MIVESKVMDYLISKNIPGIGQNVYLMTPAKTLNKYILIQKTNNSVEDMLHTTRFVIQSISRTSDYDSAVIDQEVINAMLTWEDSEIGGVDITSASVPYHNSTTKEYRYQSQFEVYHY